MTLALKTVIEACPKCKSEKVSVFKYQDTVDFRGLEFDADDLDASKCILCNHTWETKAQIKSNQQKIKATYGIHRDKLREQQGLLSAVEISNIRSYFNLNQREAALIFGGGYNAFNKYESGEVLQSLAMDRLLKLTSFIGKPALNILEGVSAGKSFLEIKKDLSKDLYLSAGVNQLKINSVTHTATIEAYNIGMLLDNKNLHSTFANQIKNSEIGMSVKNITTAYQITS